MKKNLLDKDLTIDPNHISTIKCSDSDLTHTVQQIDSYYAIFGFRIMDLRPGNPKENQVKFLIL